VKNGLGILLASLIALALGTYGGFVGASVQGMAMAPAPKKPAGPPLDCSPKEAALQTRLDALLVERSTLEATLDRRYAEAQAGPSSHPPQVMPPSSIRSLVRVALGTDVVLLHCREYPCVAVMKGEPSADALAALEAGGFAPRVVGKGDHRAIVLADASVPASDRTPPRVDTLLRLVGR